MRTTTLLSLFLLALPAAAQDADDAAALFYRAYWLEHAAGKAADAEAAYQRMLDRHPDAPEAPRALLGLTRLRAAAGRDVGELVALLRRRYPEAKREIEAARRLAVHADRPFSPRITREDSPAVRKVKELYLRLLEEELPAELRVFLADLGPVAHPALRALLRASDPGPVQRATRILLMQRSAAAHAVLRDALGDPDALFRTTIVDTVAKAEPFPEPLVEPVAALFESGARLLRGRVVRAMRAVLDSHPGHPAAYGVLRKALALADPVRHEALTLLRPFKEWPDGFAEAFVATIEKNPELEQARARLPHLADRPALAPRIERIVASAPVVHYEIPAHDAGCLLLVRVLVPRPRVQRTRAAELSARKAMKQSPAAAAWAVRHALEHAREALHGYLQSIDGLEIPDEARAGLRKAALEALYSDDLVRAEAGALALRRDHLPLQVEDWPSILEAARSDRGVLPRMVGGELIGAVGPDRALQLARLCRDARQHDTMLRASLGLAGQDGARPLFTYLVPRTSAEIGGELATLAKHYPALVALRILEADEGWRRGGWNRTNAAWDEEPVRSALLRHVTSERRHIARAAVDVAGGWDAPEATKALGRALHSRYARVRGRAAYHLVHRGAAGGDELLAYARTRGPDHAHVLERLAAVATKQHADGLRAFLLERQQPPHGERQALRHAWRAYRKADPEATVDLAFAEVKRTDGDAFVRNAALASLARTADSRRLAVYRRILRDEDTRLDVHEVIETVGEQYLVELGSDVLPHLRSTNPKVRAAARDTLEKLKFYAEAKEALRD